MDLNGVREGLEFRNTVVLNAVVRRNTQMSVKNHRRKSARERKRAQKGAKERKKERYRTKLQTTRFVQEWPEHGWRT